MVDALRAKANTGSGTDDLATKLSGGLYWAYSLGSFEVAGTPTPVSASNPLPVTTGGLTDAQLRATAVTVTGALTDAELRASALPLPTGAATETTLAAISAVFKAEDSAAADGDKGLPLLVMRQSSDTVSTSNDGDYAVLKGDEEGRLKVASSPQAMLTSRAT